MYFWFYDLILNVIKNWIDVVMELCWELNVLKFNKILLKLRECKVVYVVNIILENNFGWFLYF